MQLLISVLVPSYIRNTLLYTTIECQVEVGNIVLIPLRKSIVIGIVWSINIQSIAAINYPIKNIIEVIKGFTLDQKMINFINIVATETLSNPGLILKMILGPFIKRYKIILKKQFKVVEPSFEHKLQSILLSAEQQDIFNQIIHSQGVTVLDGVTSSGKTELYLKVTENITQDRGQVLILLPEILLATQILERAQNALSCQVYAWHSAVKQKDKDTIWTGVQNNTIKCVIGARSALFLPFNNLKMIILDEEHDIGFKQEVTPIYNAKQMALARAKIFEIPVLLVSATPSIETMYGVKQQKYQYFHLNNKNSEHANVQVQIANMWDIKSEDKIFPLLHPSSIVEIAKTLELQQQTLIFLNRKGYAATTVCTNCMSKIKCKNCDLKLTYYKQYKTLKCRHCGYIVKEQSICNTCGSKNTLVTYHPGIEKLNEELLIHFPNARILNITRDVLEKNDATSIIKQITNNEVDIVVGTQILAKGLHFANMRFCIGIYANHTQFSGDIRSIERTYQIVQQVIGRVGREMQGIAILQTFNKTSALIKCIASGTKSDFVKLELENRKIAKVPPYGGFIIINIHSANEYKLKEWLSSITMPDSNNQIKVFGPMPAAIYRLSKQYRYQILFKSEERELLFALVNRWFETIAIPSAITLTIEVDFEVL